MPEYCIGYVDPHPVTVTIRDNEEYIRVLLCSYYTTITGWGVLLKYSEGIRRCRVLGSEGRSSSVHSTTARKSIGGVLGLVLNALLASKERHRRGGSLA